jgi:hypothetical protein
MVGPVDRLVQRRHIRRATEQALLIPLREQHVEAEADEPITGPIFAGGTWWEFAGDDRPQVPPGWQAVGRHAVGRQAVGRQAITDTLTFRSTPRPWYRTRQTMIAVIAALAVAMVVWVVLVALRSPAAPSEQPRTTVTSPTPAPTSVQLSPNSIPPVVPPVVPPPPPPPPPPSAEQAPVLTGSNPAPRFGSVPDREASDRGDPRADQRGAVDHADADARYELRHPGRHSQAGLGILVTETARR